MKYISAIVRYFKMAWKFKTPIIYYLDAKHHTISREKLDKLVEEYSRTKLTYLAEYHDCDDFAWEFKTQVSRAMINGIGFVVGRWYNSWHAWNVAILDDGSAVFIELQTGSIFGINKNNYRGWLVII